MPRVATGSFDGQSVGRGQGDFFKITGTKDRKQRIAYIPGEAFEQELVPSEALKAKAKAGDKDAQQKIEEIMALREDINKSMRRSPPSAEVWTNEMGQKCMIYAKTEIANAFWIDNFGYVYDIEGIPEECKGRGPSPIYGFVVLEYEMGDDGPRMLPEGQEIDLGNGDKLRFRYQLKVAQLNDPKVRAWKEHSANFPFIRYDYEVWNEKVGKSDRAKFSPIPSCLWRENPGVMRRIIAEARKLYPNVKKNMAKEVTAAEVLKMFPEIEKQYGGTAHLVSTPQMEMPTEEADFSKLLGGGDSTPETPPEAPPETPAA